MTDNILASVKEALGQGADASPFDSEILLFINSALSNAAQLGVGPKEGFLAETDSEWDELFTDLRLNNVKQYIFIEAKLAFDPPQSGFATTALKETSKEIQWRITAAVDEINKEIADAAAPPPSDEDF